MAKGESKYLHEVNLGCLTGVGNLSEALSQKKLSLLSKFLNQRHLPFVVRKEEGAPSL